MYEPPALKPVGVPCPAVEKMPTVSQLLQSVPVFQDCSSTFVEYLAQEARVHTVPGGEAIKAMPNVQSNSLLVVMKGAIEVFLEGFRVTRITRGKHHNEAFLLGLEEQQIALLRSAEATETVLAEILESEIQTACNLHPSDRTFFRQLQELNKTPECRKGGTLWQPIQIFSGLSQAVLQRIDGCMQRRLFFADEVLVEEGTSGEELLILVRGRVKVEVNNATSIPIAVGPAHQEVSDSPKSNHEIVPSLDINLDSSKPPLPNPVCFGELSFLGIQQPRTATVIAKSVCQVRVLWRPVLVHALEEHQEALHADDMGSFLAERYKTPASTSAAKVLHNVPLFKEVGCEIAFLDFLAKHLQSRMFLSGQKIIEQGGDDRCMYLLNQGIVRVVVGGGEVATLKNGAVFGEVTVLGLATKRLSTVLAEGVCYIQVLHQHSVVDGLQQFPEERDRLLNLIFRRATAKVPSPPRSPTMGAPDTPKKGEEEALVKSVFNLSGPFCNMSAELAEELCSISKTRLFMPGDCIIQEGKRGDSMFIMISGSAIAYVDHQDPSGNGELGQSRVGTLTPGSICGELAMLGVSHIRSATIKSDTISSMWEVSQEKGLAMLDHYPEVQKRFQDIIKRNLERTVQPRMIQLPIFKHFDRKFRTLLSVYCERRVFFPGHHVVREGQSGDSMHVLNLGIAIHEKQGVRVKMYTAGSHFASTLMLGQQTRYTGTVLALQTCHVLMIPRTSYVQALEHYPMASAAKQLQDEERTNEEEMQKLTAKTVARKLISRKYQGVFQGSFDNVSDEEILRRFFVEWKVSVHDVIANGSEDRKRQTQRELEQAQAGIQRWLHRKRTAEQKAQLRRLADEAPPPSPMRRKPKTGLDDLAVVLKEWPIPSKSPFYDLNVWDVLADAAKEQPSQTTLLRRLALSPVRKGQAPATEVCNPAPGGGGAQDSPGTMGTTISTTTGISMSGTSSESPGAALTMAMTAGSESGGTAGVGPSTPAHRASATHAAPSPPPSSPAAATRAAAAAIPESPCVIPVPATPPKTPRAPRTPQSAAADDRPSPACLRAADRHAYLGGTPSKSTRGAGGLGAYSSVYVEAATRILGSTGGTAGTGQRRNSRGSGDGPGVHLPTLRRPRGVLNTPAGAATAR